MALAPAVPLDLRIRAIRGHRVMLDHDLAALYGVPTKVLLQAVRRNANRFPADFMFPLRPREMARLRSQIVTSKNASHGRGGRVYATIAFTEQGVSMLSSVLRSDRAVRVNVEIMRAFVRLRRMAVEHADLRRRIAALEKKYDAGFTSVFAAIKSLMEPPEPPPGPPPEPIGFRLPARVPGEKLQGRRAVR